MKLRTRKDAVKFVMLAYGGTNAHEHVKREAEKIDRSANFAVSQDDHQTASRLREVARDLWNAFKVLSEGKTLFRVQTKDGTLVRRFLLDGLGLATTGLPATLRSGSVNRM